MECSNHDCRVRSFGTSGLLVPLNGRLVLMNLSATDSLMQMLLNELALDDADEDIL
jgi:hypothetical protein